jgi:uncharacterized membrane protein
MTQALKTRTRDWLRPTSLIFAVLGAADATYLTYIKLAHVEALCRGVGNCESVNSSVYSQVYGIPIAIFGLAAYLGLLALLALEPNLPLLRDYGPLAVFGLALTGTLYSAYLTYVELFVIHAVCPYCVASAVLITGIFVMAVIRLARGPLDEAAED